MTCGTMGAHCGYGLASWLYIVWRDVIWGLWLQKSGICVPEACTEKVLRSQVRSQSTSHHHALSPLISPHRAFLCLLCAPQLPGGQHGVDDVHRHAGRQRHAGHAPALRLRPLPHALLRPAPRGQGLLREPLSGNPSLFSVSTWGGEWDSCAFEGGRPSGFRGFGLQYGRHVRAVRVDTAHYGAKRTFLAPRRFYASH